MSHNLPPQWVLKTVWQGAAGEIDGSGVNRAALPGDPSSKGPKLSYHTKQLTIA